MSYGNTASAMGKDLNQMIEAVADAATGEFERLKEFGIKAKVNGDQVSLIFQGVTTKVGNNAKEIESFLIKLGETKFGDAMALRMATLDGAVSNLGDTWENTFRLVNDAGLGDVMRGAVNDAANALAELNSMLASGEMEGYLEASAVAWAGWSRDITESIGAVSAFLDETWADWGDGAKDASKGMYLGFKEFPAEIRAYFQEAAVEAISFVDRLVAQGAYAKDAIAAIFDNTTLDDARKKYDATVSVSNQVRQDMIDDISQEKDATINAVNEKIESSKGLRHEYDLQQKAAKALTGDRLAQYKTKGDGSSASSSSAVERAAKAAQSLVETQAKAEKSFLATTAITTNSTNAMADAYLSGADSVRELAIQQKIEEELLKTGAGARDAVTAAVNREADAKDRLDIDQSITSMRVETTNTLAQATATLQGADALETFNIQKSMSIALSGKKIDIGSKEYEQLLEQTKAQLDANKALEQASKVEGIIDRLNPQIKLLKDYTAERDALNAAMIRDSDNVALYQDALAKLGQEYEVNQSKATIWGQLTEGAIDRIDGVFADAWANIGSGANSLWDNLVKGAKQAFGEIAHMLTTKPLLASISNWLTGTDNGQGLGSVWSKLLGSAGGSGGGGGLSSMFGGGSDSNGWGGMVSLGKNLYSAWSNLTGVGSSIASGYASGGVSGAISGGAGYYGNMLSNIATTLGSGFTSLIGGNIAITGATAAGTAATTAALTGVSAAQAAATAATVGAQGITTATLSAAVAEGAASIGTNIGVAGATTAAASSGIGAAISSAISSAAAMWPLAIVMGMYQSGKLYSAGVRPDGGEIRESAGGTALGKAVMAPGAAMADVWKVTDNALSKVVGGKWAAILSGSTFSQAVQKMLGEKLFGTGYQTKDQGIQLGVTGGDIQGYQYEDQKKKGGLISGKSKKRTILSPLDAATQKTVQDAFDTRLDDVFGIFDTLNVDVPESALDGLNMATWKISLKDNTTDQINQLVSDFFEVLGNEAVGAISKSMGLGLDTYNVDQLTEFASNLYSINDTFKLLNVNALPVSVWGGKLAEQYVALAGGMEAFSTSTQTYYDAFFSETEKSTNTLAAVKKQFADLNVTFPGTREGFRAVVEGLDSTTDAGRSMFLTLMGLSSSASTAYDILKQQLTGAATGAQSALQRAISAQQKAAAEGYNATNTSLNDMVSTVTENVSGLNSVSTSLSAALKALRGDSDDAVKMLRAQAQATLQSALATARSSKSLSGFTGLEDALDTISNNNTDLYGSMEDFARDQGRTANVVAELNAINGKQLTSAEASLAGLKTQIDLAKAAYDAQMAQYDQALEFAQAQMDALNGVDNSIMSVRDAINAMNSAVVAALSGVGGKGATNSAATNSVFIDSVYKDVLGLQGADAEGKNYWLGELANGHLNLDQLAQAIANAAKERKQDVKAGYATGGLISGPGTGTSDSIFARLSNGEYVMKASAVSMFGTGLLDQMNAGQIPAFAIGGGVGEVGPQLEVTRPSRIYSAHQAASMLRAGDGNNAQLERKVDVLIDVVK
ncbi:MAG: DUF4214 domain-containing protein, partial [Pseudomonas sp.]